MTGGLPDERLPRDFGKYRLVKKLATGGMAEIFLGHRHDTPNERVVIKRILPHLLESADFVSMFLDEARIAAQLNHPNIVQIHDVGQINGAYFIAMEYIHGEDVRRIYNQAYKLQRSLPLSHSIRVIAEAAMGLDFAHRLPDLTGKPMGVVHRDVSPQNILVTYEGGVKVVDFGIAKAANKVNQTRAGVLKGKYSYMSPEQAMGDDIDQRTDIFALGIILYETTTGTRLFKRPSELQTLQAVIKCEVLEPSDALPGYPIELEEIVMRALAKKASDRYQTAELLSLDLYRFLRTSGLYVEPDAIAEFMADLFADRLAEEAASGQPVLPPEHEAREELEAQTPNPVDALEAPDPALSTDQSLTAQDGDPLVEREEVPAPEPDDTRLSDRAQATFADERPRGPGFAAEGTTEGTVPEEDQEDIERLLAMAARQTEAAEEAQSPALKPRPEEPRRSEAPRLAEKVPSERIPLAGTKGSPTPAGERRAREKAPTDQMPTVVNHAAYRSVPPTATASSGPGPEKPERKEQRVEATEFVRSIKKNGKAEPAEGDRTAPPTERMPMASRNGAAPAAVITKDRPSIPPAARAIPRPKTKVDPRRWGVLAGLGVLFILGLVLAVMAGRSMAHRSAPEVAPIAPADEGPGEVTIHTEPSATVYLGAKVLGKADKEGTAGPFAIASGEQRIKVALESGLVRERSLIVRAGGIHEIEIRARQGWLKLVVAPWARVRIDDQDVGITPLPNLPLLEGEHRIVLENPDIKRGHEAHLKIEAGRVSELKVDLQASGAPL
ncbi:MAG: protein kinase [Myxococcota bacterium]